MKFFQNSIKFLCSLLLIATLSVQAQAQGCFFGNPLDVRAEIKNYPAQDGKCIYLLVLEDTAGNGWDGASLDVSVAEAWPATNYKMATVDGNCLNIPIYAGDGESIDFAYWNGAFEAEHGMALYGPDGSPVFEYDAGTIPSSIDRVKASCPTAICAGSTLDLSFIINEAPPVGGVHPPVQAIFLEVMDAAGNSVYSDGPAAPEDLIDGAVATLNKCETYTFVFGNTDGGTDWEGATLTITASDRSYNKYLVGNRYRFLPKLTPTLVGGMAMYDFTIPCLPAPIAPIEFTDPTADCDDLIDFEIPVIIPEICPSTCHLDCTGPAVSVDVRIGNTVIAWYTYNYPTGPSVPTITGSAPAGQHTLTYVITYYCEDIAGQNIKLCQDVELNLGTVANPTLTCNDLLHVSLSHGNNTVIDGEDCDIVVTPDMVLENVQGCESEYVVNIPHTGGNYVNGSMAGGTFTYTVTHIISGNTCWGEILVEDKQDPVLTCLDYEVDCTNPNALDEDYSALDQVCTDKELIIKEGVAVSTDFASLGCTPNGEITQKVAVIVEVDHTRPTDLKVYLNTPGGQIYLGKMNAGGVKTFTSSSTSTNNGANLAVLLNTPYADLAGNLSIELLDCDATPAVDAWGYPTAAGTGYGTFTSACLNVTHGFPDYYDVWDCTSTTVNVINEMIAETNCDQSDWNGAQIMRTIQAIDAHGNSSTCTQTVNLKAPTMDDIYKPGDASFECDGRTAEDFTPEVAGGLTFGCYDLTNDLHGLCDISFSYDDNVLPVCGNGFKIIRTWTVINWCSGVSKNHQQVIKVEDTTGPSIAQENITVGTSAYTCDADVTIADLGITDDCSGLSSATASYVAGGGPYVGSGQLVIVNLTAGGTIEGLPLGDTEIVIDAKDNCLNASSKTITITVVDDVTPIAICDDELHISLGGNGEAWLYAEDVDEGSYDNCGDITLLVSRSADGPWTESVPFDCADLNNLVTVHLQVTDEAGNSNVCWKEALIEDALPPVITCPEDKTITCDDPAVHSPFGTATAIDNCSATITSVDAGELDQCKSGELTRTFTATDGSYKSADVECTQTITVEHVSDFNVQFPADVTLTDCATADTGAPIISDDDCELVAVSSEDKVFDIVADACYKIERTFTVVNWCIYEEGAAGNTDLGTPLSTRTYRDDGDGYFKYVQIIKVLDNDAPSIENPGDLTFCDLTDGCEGEAILNVVASDDCSDAASLEYTYKIDVDADGSFDIVGQGNDANGVYPYGTHTIKWIVEDGCGNQDEVIYNFTIEDCKKPTPVCLNGISAPAMNSNGCVEIWASDLLEYAFDNCTNDSFVEGSVKIARTGDTALQSNITLCCDELGTVLVDIWVFDEAGNSDFCSTYILLQDNNGVCGGASAAASIAGHIETETGDMVEQVMVDISGAAANALPTGATGTFAFPNLSTNNNYTVTPEKDINPLNGVTTFDLVLMSKHILGTEPLATPYQMIAADVNNDGNITTFDVVQTRQLILFIVTDFPSNTSWRFVDMDYIFPNPQNPWSQAFPEAIDYNALTTDELSTDFIGVKIGDVNGNAIANNLLGSEDRNAAGTMTLATDDVAMTTGQSYTVDFRASDFNNVDGYQFTMNFDATAVTFEGVEAGALTISEANFGMTMINEGVITTSFNTADAVSVEDDAVLFSMTFAANTATNLSDVLSINSRYTAAEAYTEGEVMDVTLAFNSTTGTVVAGGTFELYQNQPNPFSDATVIGFNLPEATTATLKVYDVAGRILTVVNDNYARGYNEVSINAADLNASGVLYYQLDTPNNSATKKMIILK